MDDYSAESDRIGKSRAIPSDSRRPAAGFRVVAPCGLPQLLSRVLEWITTDLTATADSMTPSPFGMPDRRSIASASAARAIWLGSMRSVFLWGAAITVVLTVGLIGYTLARVSGLEHLRVLAEHRLDVVAASLDGELARFEYLPSLLEMNSSVSRLIDAPASGDLRNEVNLYLHGINATAGATTVYVLNQAGLCLAASDWDEPGTPLGTNLSFRPYMRDALAFGKGRFYGVGITSGLAGYYMSYALQSNGRQHGVATVKISLDKTEQAWRKLPGNVLVMDERGVSILSSQPTWKFRPLVPLTQRLRDDIATARPYGKAELVPLDWKGEASVPGETAIANLGGTRYFTVNRKLQHATWSLIVLEDTAPTYSAARNLGVTAALITAVLLLLAILQWQRQRSLRHRLANQAALQAAHDALESRVKDRTAELVEANEHLADEVSSRVAIESNLRATQDELVHAGKMAVLGQLSAGMVHEINQPLAAMRTLSDNACVFIGQGRSDEACSNLRRVAQLTDRLGLVTHQLTVFAHKARQPPKPAVIQHAIAGAQFLLSHRLRERDVELETKLWPASLAALTDEVRLEQVLVNIIGNGIDAVSDRPVRRIVIEAKQTGDRCVLTVTDTGTGIRADVLSRLFEPFVTTKSVGTGLGLGLVISAHIVRDSGGTLRAANLDAGGACFVIELPVATEVVDLRRRAIA